MIMAQLCKPFTECSLWIIYPLPYHISPSYWLCTHRNMIYQASTAKLSLLTTTSAEKSLIISPYFSVMHSFAGSVDIFSLSVNRKSYLHPLSSACGLFCSNFILNRFHDPQCVTWTSTASPYENKHALAFYYSLEKKCSNNTVTL